MRSITTTGGAEVIRDGDLLAVLEALYKELNTPYAVDRTFEDTVREVNHLLDQMTNDARISWRACSSTP